VQLQHPEPVQILERYDADLTNEEEFLTEEQRRLRREKSEKYKKLLAAHRYDIGMIYIITQVKHPEWW